ncbi:MAG: GWxTD domain-containing protein [Candidatus Aminicenantales bacterium]
MRKSLLVHVILGFLVGSLVFPAERIREKDLPEKYREWLKLVAYIIRPEEKDVFLQLENDRERDIFIETFWKQRDPTPGTPDNEYREEHIKRFNYANSHFRRQSAREGWMTDMGRFYIILGPPASIERFEISKGIYPVQVWYYYGEKEKGLPPHFALVFFQRGGGGEFKLYDPVSDGPAALMIEGKDMDPFDYEGVYEKLMELAPTLALVSLSMIPGDIPFNYQPSPRNNIIIADILESPKKEVNPAYATHFLDYKGVVSTEYLTNYIDSDGELAVIEDPMMGLNFLHFTVVPKSLSIDYYEPRDQYFCNFTATVSLRKGEDIVFQYSKEFPLYFSPDELEKVRANGLAIEDSFPAAEGEYQMTVLLTNSVGKEFTIYEQNVHIPEPAEGPYLVGPFLGYRFETYGQNLHIPFKVGDKKLVVDPQKTYGAKDTISLLFLVGNLSHELWESGTIEIKVNGLRDVQPVEKTQLLHVKGFPFRRVVSVLHTLSAKDLAPDYYDLSIRLKDGNGQVVDERTGNFVISPAEAIAHPIAHAKGFPLSRNYAYYYMVASQYRKTGQTEAAEAMYRKAFAMNPGYRRGLMEYADFLYETGKFQETLDLIETIKDEENLRFNYYLIRGKAYMGMEQYFKAIESLEEGNKIYNSDTTLLNALGVCYFRTNQKEKALAVLKASLRLNPEQEDVKRLLSEIEGK